MTFAPADRIGPAYSHLLVLLCLAVLSLPFLAIASYKAIYVNGTTLLYDRAYRSIPPGGRGYQEHLEPLRMVSALLITYTTLALVHGLFCLGCIALLGRMLHGKLSRRDRALQRLRAASIVINLLQIVFASAATAEAFKYKNSTEVDSVMIVFACSVFLFGVVSIVVASLALGAERKHKVKDPATLWGSQTHSWTTSQSGAVQITEQSSPAYQHPSNL